MIEFIFMLTRDDVTLADAREVYASIAADGRPPRRLQGRRAARATSSQALMDDIRAQRPHDLSRGRLRDRGGRRSRSARAAAEIRPDYLIGGTLIEPVQEILAGTGVKFFPYVGQIVGHPCLLRGSIDEIVADTQARRRARRRRHQPARLPLRRRRRGARRAPSSAPPTCRSSAPARSTPSSASARSTSCGAWAFTIGTAALDGVLVEGAPLSGQLQAALARRRRPGLGGRPRPSRARSSIDALVDHPADHVELLAVGRLERRTRSRGRSTTPTIAIGPIRST